MVMSNLTIPETPEKSWGIVQKWGPEAVSVGFTLIPNHLLAINQFMPPERRLTSTEHVVLLQLVGAWWSARRPPFPSKATLARRAGLSPRQIQRAINGLENKGFLKRISRFTGVRGRTSNAYDLQGSVETVRDVAKEYPQAFKREPLAMPAQE